MTYNRNMAEAPRDGRVLDVLVRTGADVEEPWIAHWTETFGWCVSMMCQDRPRGDVVGWRERGWTMNAITLWQPWASMVACSRKKFETRTWRPPRWAVGQPLAIHAAARRPVVPDKLHPELVEVLEDEFGGHWYQDVPRGAVVATCILAEANQILGGPDGRGHVDVRPLIGRPPVLPTLRPDPFGDYSVGRWSWHLKVISRLPRPVPAKGAQRVWTWTPEMEV